MILNLTVTYSSGDVKEVAAGQREMSAWEMQPFGCNALEALSKTPVTYMRFIAYDALRRAKELPTAGMPFDGWSERVDSVEFTPDKPTEEPVPTKPGRSAGR